MHNRGVDYCFKETYYAAKMVLEGGPHSPGTHIAAHCRQHSLRRASAPGMAPAAALSPDMDDCFNSAFSAAKNDSITRCGPCLQAMSTQWTRWWRTC